MGLEEGGQAQYSKHPDVSIWKRRVYLEMVAGFKTLRTNAFFIFILFQTAFHYYVNAILT